MKIVVIVGTCLIGSKTVAILRRGGHEALAAAPNTGVNTITGEGLKEALAGAQVVVDVANSPSSEKQSGAGVLRDLRPQPSRGGGRGGQRPPPRYAIHHRRRPYAHFLAKVAQEKLVKASGLPNTIIRSTEFLESLRSIAASSADGNIVRLSPGLFQPIAADDVAAIVGYVFLTDRQKNFGRGARAPIPRRPATISSSTMKVIFQSRRESC
jgi:uncharacterized protein YbjT (DUF2867 family)